MAKQIILWTNVRDRPEAWAHIRSSVAGDKDTATCIHCGVVVDMEGEHAKRSSAVLKLARSHFYKHKLGLGLPPRQVAADPLAQPLF